MKISSAILGVSLAAGCLLAPGARAGWQKDSVCQGGCGGGCGPCGSSSGGGGGGGSGIAWGGMTQRAFNMMKQDPPLGALMDLCLLVPIGLFMDAPVYLAKGVGYGVVGLGKGVYYGGAAVGRGIAYPFKAAGAASAERKRKAVAVVVCVDGPSGGESFDAYRAWEECKRNILKRQKAYAKQNGSKDEYLWCKGHIPLSSGPNTSAWLSRCNSGGATTFGPQLVPAPPAQAAALAPAVQAAAPEAAPVSTVAPATAVAEAPLAAASAGQAAAAPPSADAAVKAAGQSGFDSKGTMLGANASDASTITTPPSSAAAPAAVAAPVPSAAAPAPIPAPKASEAPPVETKTPEVARAAPVVEASAPVAGTAAAEPVPALKESRPARRPKAKGSGPKGTVVARKAVDCALKPFLAQLSDPVFAADVRSEVKRVFNELAAVPAGGKADVQQVYAISRDAMVHSKAGDRQAVLQASVQRVDADGEIHVDVQFSLKNEGVKSSEGQTIVKVASNGAVEAVDLNPEARRCLGL